MQYIHIFLIQYSCVVLSLILIIRKSLKIILALFIRKCHDSILYAENKGLMLIDLS
jgi:hypothetical protein